ncbi:MAG: MFS transporter [Acidobacteria bacterium]|jgi:UMF1 family MFS transporter|nr:MFS transporter [Acidobacteriota bacterium]MBA4182494.1 MFS transporter [Acidobacteriota bacterium]
MELKKNDRREIFGWLIYDWANSAFYTTVVSVLLGPYLTSLAQAHVGENGVIFDFRFLGAVTAKNLFSLSITVSVFCQVLFLPILGGIADYSNLKKRLMTIFCYLGVTASCLLFFITDNYYVTGSVLLIVANLCFGAANIFYNAYLVDLTTEDRRDFISSYGFAAGYLGGIIMLLLNIYFVQNAESLGLSTSFAVRLSLLAASLWWGFFAFFTFYLIRSRGAAKSLPQGENLASIGFSELGKTFKTLLKLRYTAQFLIASFCYNNGIQTVITSASVFLAQELFVARGEEASQSFLLGIFLAAQISALIGAILFERVARITGAKTTLLISLIIWICIVIFAYGFLQTVWQAWIMSVFIGLVLGSSQALSRSLYSQMIPKGRESSFFGLYEISERGTTLVGSLVFGIVVGITGSFRQAILSMIIFFAIGIIILLFTDTNRAIHLAGNQTPEEAAKTA